MKFMTDQKIENLKRDNPNKKILRMIFLISGLISFILGLTFLIIGFDFGLILLDLNFSFMIDVIIIIFGMILISKYFIASYYLRENSIVFKKVSNLRETVNETIRFTSISFSRLIAATLLIFAGILSLSIFGTAFGHEVPHGSAVFLGGPSWFYVTGLPALGFGFGLFLYFLLSPFRGIFSKSDHFYFFNEIRPGFPWLTEIPLKDIEMNRYQNNHLGPKLTWIPLFFPFIIMQLMTSISLFSAERAAPEFVLSWTFMVISIIEILVLIVLLFFQQEFFEIATESRLYEMWFSPIKCKKHSRSSFNDEFSEFLRIKQSMERNSFQNDISKRHFKLFNFLFGCFLIVLALIMMIYMTLFGPLVWWFSIIYGSILITKSLSSDFSDKNGQSIQFVENSKYFLYKKEFKYKFEYFTAFDLKKVEVKKWFRKLDAFDVLFITALIFLSTLQQGFGWGLANSAPLIFDNIVSTIILGILLVIILLYTCLPVDVIEIRTKSIIHRLPVTLKRKQNTFFKNWFKNFKTTISLIFSKELRKTFYLRLGCILLIVLCVSIYLLVYFSLFF